MRKHHKIAMVLAAFVLAVCAGVILVPRSTRATGPCPCSIWASNPSPTIRNDGHSIETGVKFSADVDGYITGVKFYKVTGMGGTHTGHLWDQYGEKLAEATFTGESATGWQTVTFANPVKVTQNTLYMASYYAADGNFVGTDGGLAAPVDNSPLHVPADGTAGAMDGLGNNHNGLFTYDIPAPPYQVGSATNYWVDVLFDTAPTDSTPPTAVHSEPSDGSYGAAPSGPYSVKFSEQLDPATVNSGTVTLKTAGGASVGASISYDDPLTTVRVVPSSPLSAGDYTVAVSGVKDLAGNDLASPYSFSFTVGTSAPASVGTGPGGPILVITTATNKFTTYFTEILKAEGFNEFDVADIGSVSAPTLASHKLAILGDMSLTGPQVTMLTSWVQGGGRLIASHPDKQLASLLGLTDAAGTITDGYLKIDASVAPGLGLESQTMQYHTAADEYTLNGATSVANLYTDASTATAYPAVSRYTSGSGQAAAFTYDLAKSIVYQHQGNPAWAGTERDGDSVIRPDDMFYPNWVDLTKVAIPQADEQQRLLGNLITSMMATVEPLPHFWYFPKVGANPLPKAAVVMALDDHGSAAETMHDANRLSANSPASCTAYDWTCYRSTSWLYTSSGLTAAGAAALHDQGFDLGVHITSGCANWTLPNLQADYINDLGGFATKYPGLPPQTGNRIHCLAWDDWASIPKTDAAHGIRLDQSYYYYPNTWITDRPGFMTGSGLSMRFADTDGSLIDVYNQDTDLTSDTFASTPAAITTQLDNATGPTGYYGFIGTHYDETHAGFQASLIAAAKAHNLPMISAQQLVSWQDGREASSFGSLNYDNHELTFDISAASGANNLQAMLPEFGPSGILSSVKRGGTVLAYSTSNIKGVDYDVFDAAPGSYTACYNGCNPAPASPSPSPSATPTATPTSTPASGSGHSSNKSKSTNTSSSAAATSSADPTSSPSEDSSSSPTPTATPKRAGNSTSPTPTPATTRPAPTVLTAGVGVGGLSLLIILIVVAGWLLLRRLRPRL